MCSPLFVFQAYPGKVYKSSALKELYSYVTKYSTEVGDLPMLPHCSMQSVVVTSVFLL